MATPDYARMFGAGQDSDSDAEDAGGDVMDATSGEGASGTRGDAG